MNHAELQELCGSYALGALDGEELDAFRRHLPACWECRQRVLEFEEIYAEGALTLQPVEPSPGVKERLLERATGERPAAEVPSGAAAEPPPGRGTRPPRRLPRLLAAAALLLAVSVSAFLAGRVASGDAGHPAPDLARLLRDPDLQTLPLAGGEGAPAASGRVLWTGDQLALTSDGLPPADEGRTYWLWALSDGRKLALDRYRPGEAPAALDPARLPESVDGFALSLEPTGGDRGAAPASPSPPLYLRPG